MKSKLRSSRPLKFLVALSAVTLLSVSGAFANYGAFVSSTGAGSFGAFGLSWNWRTNNGAINAAVMAAQVVGQHDRPVLERLRAWRQARADEVLASTLPSA
jgi:hypothetical protein